MKRGLLLRAGDASEETLAEIRAHAEAGGFTVTVQARVGRLPVTARPNFAERLADALEEMRRDKLSLRATARKLGIGAATLHRLLHAEEHSPVDPRPHPP